MKKIIFLTLIIFIAFNTLLLNQNKAFSNYSSEETMTVIIDFYTTTTSNTCAVYKLRADIHLSYNHYQEAIVDLEKLVYFIQNNAEQHYLLGSAYLMLNQYDKALENLNKAIALDNKYYLPHLAKAMLYAKNNNFQQAIIHIDQAIELNIIDNKLYMGITKMHQLKDDYQKALQNPEQPFTTQIEPTILFYTTYYTKGEALKMLEYHQKAQEAFMFFLQNASTTYDTENIEKASWAIDN